MNKSPEELITMLEETNELKRALALKFIGKYRYLNLIDHCVESLEDPSAEVREFAAWALDQLGSPQTVPALLNALYDPVFGVRSNAGWALVHIARRTIPNIVVPDVIDVLQDTDENAQQMAYLVLHHIGGETARAAIRHYWKK